MTTILNLPEEVLRNIFGRLHAPNLIQCQKVCRSWYRPAHITLLQELGFTTSQQIKKFVASIDHNPDDSYLSAVKRIAIWGADSPDFQFDKDFIVKLFFRFKNIEKICIFTSLSLFEGIDNCDGFEMTCPKLNEFEVRSNSRGQARYYDVVWKLRQILTKLEIEDTHSLAKYGGTTQYISQFPRLTTIHGFSNYRDPTQDLYLDSFEKLFPVFEHLDNLTDIFLQPGKEKENFAERFLASKTKDVQDTILQRLTHILYIHCHGKRQYCANSLKFIRKYLTGLESFRINSGQNDNWTLPQRKAFINDLLNIVCSVKKEAYASLFDMQLSDLSSCFPVIMDRLFRLDSPTTRILQIKMTDPMYQDEDNIEEEARLNVEYDQSICKIHVSIPIEYGLNGISSKLLNKVASISNTDEFILAMEDRGARHNSFKMVANMNEYDAILMKMPSVKKVTLDIPASYTEIKSTSKTEYPLVETVTLRSNSDKTIQGLLDRYSYGFPNLKQLSLHYFLPIYDSEAEEYWVRLTGYKLEKLEIDVTILMEVTYRLSRDFFIIVVDTGERRRVCKVSIDLSFIKIINASEIRALGSPERYIPMHIKIDSLDRLELCGQEHDTYFDEFYHPEREFEDYMECKSTKRGGISFNTINH